MSREGVLPTPAIFPAIDLRGGRTVRLVRGARGAQIDYGDDPVAAARRWVEAGAEWIHAIDLGAAFGEPNNRAVIADISRAVPVPVQAGGGLRDDQDIDHLLGEGVARVILGTRALRDPGFLERVLARHGAGRVVLAMDLAGEKVRVKGWEEESGLDLAGGLDLAWRSGIEHVLLTAIDRDGTLAGPDIDLVRRALEAGTASVVAAGGIGRLEDVRALLEIRHARLEGVVVGRALYEGTVSLAEAVALSRKYRAVPQEHPHVSSTPPNKDLRQDRAASSGEGGLDAVLDGVKYDASGLVPAVVQDAADGQVLMVAYMNREALRRTITSGATCFWSRSRQEYWVKGATSGNTQKVVRVMIDCDADCVLVVVAQKGVACHTGMRSCFFREAGAEGLREIDTSGPIYRR